MIIRVSTTAELNAAIKTASGGDTLLLAPGTYELTASSLTFTSAVTITSADAARPATVTSININSSRGLTLRDLELFAPPSGGDNAFRVTNSQDIAFQRLDVHGSLDGDPRNDVSAFLIRTSTNVSVTDSQFQQLWHALAHLDSTDLTFRGNVFHDIRTDGIRGGGSSRVTIADNRFYDFQIATGDHGDAIQFWTTNTTTNATDIVITGNVFLRGAGSPIQGVFMGNGLSGVIYERVRIEGNLIVGAGFHGITVGAARNVTVRGNIVQGHVDVNAWIRLEGVAGGVISGNQANNVILEANTRDVVTTDNFIIGRALDGGAQALANWRALVGTGVTDAGQQGGAGAETLIGGSGASRVFGGDGDDVILEAWGANYLRGEAGNDVLRGGFEFDDINGNTGDDTVMGGLGDDWVVGGRDNDLLYGDEGQDLVYGNLGNDTLDGGTGADTLRGGQGDDIVQGGAGADFLSGDRGNDTMTGGAGADTFSSFGEAGIDRVTDFNRAEGDQVRLDPGTTYAVAQVGADTVISMGGGGQVVLVGVAMSSLTAGWITA